MDFVNFRKESPKDADSKVWSQVQSSQLWTVTRSSSQGLTRSWTSGDKAEGGGPLADVSNLQVKLPFTAKLGITDLPQA